MKTFRGREANREACRRLQMNFIGERRNRQVREREERKASTPSCRHGNKKGEGDYKKENSAVQVKIKLDRKERQWENRADSSESSPVYYNYKK